MSCLASGNPTKSLKHSREISESDVFTATRTKRELRRESPSFCEASSYVDDQNSGEVLGHPNSGEKSHSRSPPPADNL